MKVEERDSIKVSLYDLCLFEKCKYRSRGVSQKLAPTFTIDLFTDFSEHHTDHAQRIYNKIENACSRGPKKNSRGAFEYCVLHELGFIYEYTKLLANKINDHTKTGNDSYNVGILDNNEIVLFKQPQDMSLPNASQRKTHTRHKNRSIKDITSDILKAVNHRVSSTDPNIWIIKLDQRGVKQLLEINETIEETKKQLPSNEELDFRPLTEEWTQNAIDVLRKIGFGNKQFAAFLRPKLFKELLARNYTPK